MDGSDSQKSGTRRPGRGKVFFLYLNTNLIKTHYYYLVVQTDGY